MTAAMGRKSSSAFVVEVREPVAARASLWMLLKNDFIEGFGAGWMLFWTPFSSLATAASRILKSSVGRRSSAIGSRAEHIDRIAQQIAALADETGRLAMVAAAQARDLANMDRDFAAAASSAKQFLEQTTASRRDLTSLILQVRTIVSPVTPRRSLGEAGHDALTEIDEVSRRLEELIMQVSASAGREADAALRTAENIQHILETRPSTERQVHELTRMAVELQRSVSRLKIA